MNLTLQLFQSLMSNGLMLAAIVEKFGKDAVRKVLAEYVLEMNAEEIEDIRDEYLFYEEEDEEVLRDLGFENLIAE